jgi:hypothetical protein
MLLVSTARRDSYTGPDVNDEWGFGKLDIPAAIERLAPSMPTPTATPTPMRTATQTRTATTFRTVTSHLSASINATQSTIPLVDVEAFPASGIIQIDDELLSYVGVTAAGFLHVGRGLRGTAAADHLEGAIVRLVAPLCTGDCNADARVAVNELILGVGIALNRTPLSQCVVFDEGADGKVAVSELVQAVAFALRGCP